jgi:Kef-type K+ transport system membrane component KefB
MCCCRFASKELVQLSLVSLCLSTAWVCGRLGLSEELGAFIAGVMMSVAERKLTAAGVFRFVLPLFCTLPTSLMFSCW